jgi:hypothetical protein
MRDRQEIEQEMFHAREDLEQNLGELKQNVRERVDVPNRVRHVVEEKKQQARELARRGKDGMVRAYDRSVSFTKERPALVGGVFAGIVLGAIGVALLFRWRANNRPWYERLYELI